MTSGGCSAVQLEEQGEIKTQNAPTRRQHALVTRLRPRDRAELQVPSFVSVPEPRLSMLDSSSDRIVALNRTMLPFAIGPELLRRCEGTLYPGQADSRCSRESGARPQSTFKHHPLVTVLFRYPATR